MPSASGTDSARMHIGPPRALVAALAGVALAAALLSTGARADEAKKLKIIFVSPLAPGNTFALPIIKGFELAGSQLGVDVIYRGNQNASLMASAAETKRTLENAIAAKPDGLVVANTYPGVLNETIKAAVDSGIPVVLSNTGLGEQKNVGALSYVGTDGRKLGKAGAEKLRELGAKNVLVVTIPPGVPLVDFRMEGIAEGIAPAKTTIVQVPLEALGDSTRLVNTMLASIQKDPTIDAVFSIGSCCGAAMVAAREQLGDRAKGMYFGTIDLGPPVLDALKEGKVDFALDQQQFLEGYMPVVILTNYLRYAIEPVDSQFLTGPGMVTQKNAERITQLVDQNFR